MNRQNWYTQQLVDKTALSAIETAGQGGTNLALALFNDFGIVGNGIPVLQQANPNLTVNMNPLKYVLPDGTVVTSVSTNLDLTSMVPSSGTAIVNVYGTPIQNSDTPIVIPSGATINYRLFDDVNFSAVLSTGVQPANSLLLAVVTLTSGQTTVLQANINTSNAPRWIDIPTILAEIASKQGGLGFTPVQQGTGVGQLSNVVKLGWDGINLRFTIDSTDEGYLVSGVDLTNVEAQIASNLAAAVSAETNRAEGVEGNLQTSLNNEANTRSTNDTTLQTNISNETTARTNEDTTLQGEIAALQTLEAEDIAAVKALIPTRTRTVATGARAFGVQYQNTTPFMRIVDVVAFGTGGYGEDFEIAGSAGANSGSLTTFWQTGVHNSGGHATLTMHILPDEYYMVSNPSVGENPQTPEMISWIETSA